MTGKGIILRWPSAERSTNLQIRAEADRWKVKNGCLPLAKPMDFGYNIAVELCRMLSRTAPARAWGRTWFRRGSWMPDKRAEAPSFAKSGKLLNITDEYNFAPVAA